VIMTMTWHSFVQLQNLIF